MKQKIRISKLMSYTLRHNPRGLKASLDSLTRKGILCRSSGRSYQFFDIFMRYWISHLLEKADS